MIKIDRSNDRTSLIFDEDSLPAIVIPLLGMTAYRIDKAGCVEMLDPREAAPILSSVPLKVFQSLDQHQRDRSLRAPFLRRNRFVSRGRE